jgi:pimeloyl-ACP methyl ester carboxylesterase
MKRTAVAAISAVSVIAAMGWGVADSSASSRRAASTAAAVTPAAFTPAPVRWGRCADPDLTDAGLDCATLLVPLDYAKPSGAKIKLALSRRQHASTRTGAGAYQGIMLVNPGGPGASGLSLPLISELVPQRVGDVYDWIGFAPRGVEGSTPALTCDSGYAGLNRPRYEPTSSAVEKAWLLKTKNYAAACDKAGGALLDHVRTIDTVRDMESIRIALGRKQINLYGFSYGTYLGQVYSSVFPANVRRMVLDGVVDPRRVWYRANLDQDFAFEKSIRVFFDWVASNDSVYHLGTVGAEVADKYYAQIEKLAVTPAGGKVGPSEWNDAFVQAGYYVYGWESVAEAFASAVNSNRYKPVLDLYLDSVGTGAGRDNGYAMYLATQCSDSGWPKELSALRTDNAKAAVEAPFITWNNAWFNAPCRFWGAKNGKLTPVVGSATPRFLLISETFDGATPYSGAIEVRKRFPGSVLVEGVNGTTHAGSLSGVTCTDDTIADFLLTGHLPKRQPGDVSDRKCAPVPQPDPTAVAPAAAADSRVSRAALQAAITGR